MTEKEIKEFVAEIRRKSDIFRNSGFATTGITNVFDKSADIIEELLPYMAIDTVEEFKALKEKNVAKKPRFYAHNYYCTECGNLVGNNEFEWQRFLYCDKCGQKLDWQ